MPTGGQVIHLSLSKHPTDTHPTCRTVLGRLSSIPALQLHPTRMQTQEQGGKGNGKMPAWGKTLLFWALHFSHSCQRMVGAKPHHNLVQGVLQHLSSCKIQCPGASTPSPLHHPPKAITLLHHHHHPQPSKIRPAAPQPTETNPSILPRPPSSRGPISSE